MMARLFTPVFDADGDAATPPAATPPVATPPKSDDGAAAAAEVAQLRKELEAAKAKAKSWEDTNLMLDDSKDNTERAAAARRVMEATGRYTAEEINKHLAEAYGAAPGGEGGDPNDGGGDDEGARRSEQDHNVLKNEVIKLKRESLKGRIDVAVSDAVRKNEALGKLHEKLVVLKGKAKADEAVRQIKAQLFDPSKEDGTVVRNLRQRVERNRGRFDDSWISEEVERTTSEEAQRYLSVIEDIDIVGRSSETVSGAKEFLASTPVKAPQWSPGSTRGQVEADLLKFNQDALSRVALAAAKPNII